MEILEVSSPFLFCTSCACRRHNNNNTGCPPAPPLLALITAKDYSYVVIYTLTHVMLIELSEQLTEKVVCRSPPAPPPFSPLNMMQRMCGPRIVSRSTPKLDNKWQSGPCWEANKEKPNREKRQSDIQTYKPKKLTHTHTQTHTHTHKQTNQL